MTEVPIFIASSIREFQMERLLLSPFIEMLNGIYKRMDAQIVWNRPETQFGVIAMGGSQKTLDEFIDECAVFVLIVGEKAGEYTEGEFQRALGRFRRTDGKEPIILPCFLRPLSEESGAFLKRVRAPDIGQQYIEPYDNFDAALNRLQMVLADYIVNHAPQSDAETDMNRARERIIEKIHSLQADIEKLQAAPPSQETIAEITLAYAEIWRLVREYKVEPDALLDYMKFLHKQHQYDTGIKVGHWLEGFYQMENPGDYRLSLLKNRLGLCYAGNNQHEQAEKYYREALEINRRLVAEDPDFEVFEDNVALTCNNLAALFYQMNRMEEAERLFGEALDIRRRLAESHPVYSPAYWPDVAQTCNNLACLLDDTNCKEEAEKYHREALEIRRHLADLDSAYLPDVATTCNNLACLFYQTNRMEEAEKAYREALEIRRGLADANPDAYLPDVAMTCNNMGILLKNTNRMKEAEKYYREALDIRRRLAEANPGAYLPNVADTCNNMGNLLWKTNRMEEAEKYYREALETYRRLSERDSAYLPAVAGTCNNMGNLLSDMNRMEEVENYYREALEIYRRFADANPAAYLPYVAVTCNNLGNLLRRTNRMEEAESYYREALDIRRRLAEANPGAYLPNVATVCYNMGEFELQRNPAKPGFLGLFKRKQGNRDAARLYFEEALSIYEKFPHLAKYAQMCRERLDELPEA